MTDLPEIPAEVKEAIDAYCQAAFDRGELWRGGASAALIHARDGLNTALRTWARSIAEAERAHGEMLEEALERLVERRERACRDFGIPDRMDGSDGRYARARAALTAWRNR